METQYLFPLKSDFANKNNLEKDLQIALRNFANRLPLPSAIANRLFILQEGTPAPHNSVVLFGHRKGLWSGEPLRNKGLLSSFLVSRVTSTECFSVPLGLLLWL